MGASRATLARPVFLDEHASSSVTLLWWGLLRDGTHVSSGVTASEAGPPLPCGPAPGLLLWPCPPGLQGVQSHCGLAVGIVPPLPSCCCCCQAPSPARPPAAFLRLPGLPPYAAVKVTGRDRSRQPHGPWGAFHRPQHLVEAGPPALWMLCRAALYRQADHV